MRQNLFMRRVLVGWLAAAWSCIGMSAELRIDLPKQVTVEQSRVRLGQVATITGTDLEVVRQLVYLPLGTLSRGQQPHNLDRQQLSRWIRSTTNVVVDRVIWGGSPQTTIVLQSTAVRATEIETAARQSLEAWLAPRSDRHEIRLASRLSDLATDAGEVHLQGRLNPADIPSRRMRVWVDVVSQGRPVQSIPVSFDVRAYRSALTAGNAFPAGRIDKKQLVNAEVEITALAGEAVTAEGGVGESADEWRTAQSIAKGGALLQANVGVAPMVVRGDWVEVISRRGGVSIQGRGQALQDGSVGDAVRIQVHGALGSLVARVLDKGRVEVLR